MKKEIINKSRIFLYTVTTFLPVVTFAQNLVGIRNLVTQIGGIIDLARPIVFSLAILYFFWGIGQFILNAGDSKLREEGKQKMIWGVIALFVMVSIFGIIAFIGTLTGVNTGLSTTPSPIPSTPTPQFPNAGLPGGSPGL